MTTATHTGLARLRDPFEATDINKLPKPYKAESPKGKCSECGGYHGLPAAHLDYVGHAALTARLLDADPAWTYEFVATDPNTGAPLFDANGGLWIRLTVCGVTRLGYGDAQGKKGGNAVKEAIGDALRNAGMRFGAALDLWHKGDLSDARAEQGVEGVPESQAAAATPPSNWKFRISEALTYDELKTIHGEAMANGWANPDVMSVLNARRAHL